MDYETKCTACNRGSQNLLDYKCQRCGQPLEIRTSGKLEPDLVDDKTFGFWRYARFFPYVREEDIVTLGEGWTPLVKHSGNVSLKLENLNPTGSFKDRGSTMLVSATCRQVKKAKGYIAEDSSGNAGASIAAYSARAGLKARIYVPETVAGPKFSQIQFHGAEVRKIAGSRSKVAEEAQKPEKGKFYVGHILHPLFRDGIRSLAYEIAEQTGWKMPDRVYLPCSAGTLLLGVLSGFGHLVESGVIETMPTVVACQTSQVSPLYHRLKGSHYHPPEKVTSVADALVSVNPPLLDLMVRRLKEADGDAVLVDEDDILQAFAELAKQGFFVEPSSAVAYAAYEQQLKSRQVSRAERKVIVLTGSGLKTTLKPRETT
jgi:threonine synthase